MRRVLFVAMLVVAAEALLAQVAIIRTLPDEGTNPVDPEWSAPAPESIADGVAGTRLKGTLAVGGSAVARPSRTLSYSAFLDGRASLAQQLGAGALTLSADVARSALLDGFEEGYAAAARLTMPAWSLAVEGEYENVDDPEEPSRLTALAAETTVSVIATLPLTVSGSYNAERTGERDGEELAAALGAKGTLGEIGVELDASHTVAADLAERAQTTQSAGSLGVRVPLGRVIGVIASVAPTSVVDASYSNGTTDPATAVSRATLDSALGIVFGGDEGLGMSLTAGRRDAWEDAHRSRWSGTAGLSFVERELWSSSAAYTLATPPNADAEEPYTHTAEVAAQWTPASSPVGSGAVGLSGRLIRERDTDAQAELSATLEPADGLALGGEYDGDFEIESGELIAYEQATGLSFDHTPDPLVSYALGAALSFEHGSSGRSASQTYDAAIVLSPMLGAARYPFSLTEELLVDPDEGVASTLSASATVPAGPATAHYSFAWERLLPASTSAVSDSFRHAAGLVFDGELATASVDYGLSHGSTGLRHDVRGGLTVPLFGRIGARAEAELSSYTQDGEKRLPFLIRVASTYEF